MSTSRPDNLNTLCACFENNSPAEEVQKAQDPCPLVISRAGVCRSFKRINPRKTPGPDGTPGQTLKVCTDQLADVFGDIFNMSLFHSVIPTGFKETAIVPPTKKSKTLSLNDCHPVALTSTIMKHFEWLVKTFTTSSLPLTGPTSVCLQTKQIYGRHHCHSPPHCPLLPRPKEHLCENVVH